MVLFGYKHVYLGQMVNEYIVLSSKSKDKTRTLTQGQVWHLIKCGT